MEKKKKRADKYDTKLKIKGDLDSVLKTLVKSPLPNLKKRKGNKCDH